ncbi:hypothetical protein [Desulfovibrio ferrophilus]|uniref:hypothetical protein n=1 Tax=Desulfovibrio ferrophilus TaxID=241368 RepID=UPI000F840116|nr:hypothetical protein [Desulfovibrio ferrophilus]
MQNRYFGDVGDFTKYGMLRNAVTPSSRLGILWCLANNETHNNDGKHTAYLQKSNNKEFRSCDPFLFDALKKHLVDEQGNIIPNRRNVSHIRKIQILPENTIYYENTIKVPKLNERMQERQHWFQQAQDKLKDCDIVFCDPDNGIEVPSTSKKSNKHCKYIFWDELKKLWASGKSLIIYQHMHMGKPHPAQFGERIKAIQEHLDTETVLSIRCFRGTVRTYFLIPQPCHHHHFTQIVETMTSGPWAKHINSWK